MKASLAIYFIFVKTWLFTYDFNFQKVLASRESLADMEEMVSDDAILIQDFNSQAEPDPFLMPEVHEHMIRFVQSFR